MTGWLITFEEANGRRTILQRVRTWEAGMDALYALVNRWGFNNQGPAGNAHIREWADRQRSYLASWVLIGRRERPRQAVILIDRERSVRVRLERRVAA